jgi:beta-N-acetylhexosaminidase
MKASYRTNGGGQRPIPHLTILFIFLLLITAPIISQEQPDAFDAIIASLTLEQKVGQLFLVNLYGDTLTQGDYDLLQQWRPGGIVLFPSNTGTPEKVAELTNSYQQAIINATGIPAFVATDQEGGLISRLTDGFTHWPLPMVLTAANDPDLAYRVGQGMAQELRAVGVNINLAPVADLRTNLDNLVIGRRSPGSDPAMVGLMLAGLIRGMQDGGVMTAVKHFPGHGDTSLDSHLTLPTLDHDRERLYAVELPPFVSAINAGSGAVMIAHLWLPEFDPTAPLPATLSQNIVTGLLRESLGYEGLIMTDALDMDAVTSSYTTGEAAVLAIQAGVDLIPVGPRIGEVNLTAMIEYTIDAVRSGQLAETRVDESVRRILQAKQQLGLSNWSPLDTGTTTARMGIPTNQMLVEEIYRAGVTLAYDSNNLIPLQPATQVGIIFPGNISEILYACNRYSTAINWMPVLEEPANHEIEAAAELANRVDRVVVFTNEAYSTRQQQWLVNALPEEKTVVIALGSPYDWRRFPQVAAYIATYDLSDAALTTSCGILFGAYPALGRLPVSLGEELPVGSTASN